MSGKIDKKSRRLKRLMQASAKSVMQDQTKLIQHQAIQTYKTAVLGLGFFRRLYYCYKIMRRI